MFSPKCYKKTGKLDLYSEGEGPVGAFAKHKVSKILIGKMCEMADI